MHERLIELGTRFVDSRGSIQNILTRIEGEDEPIRHIAIITSREYTWRGSHYHKVGGQWIYVIEGLMTSESIIADESARMSPVHKLTVPEGSLLYCPPGVAHRYRFDADTTFLNIDTAPRGQGQDTYPFTF